MSRTKVLCIQPHSDDAILSCGNFLFDEEYSVKVLTVEKNDRRLEEDKKISNLIGVKYFSLGFPVTDDGYTDFFNQYGKKAELNDENVLEFYSGRLSTKKIKLLQAALIAKVKKYIGRGYMILCPMGVGHPFHYLVRYLLREIDGEFIFYREFPHSYKRRAKNQFDGYVDDFELIAKGEDKEINTLKYEIAQKFYKTQSGFFFYEHGNIEKLLPEEYYIYKENHAENENTTTERHIKIYVVSKGRPNGKTFYFLRLAGIPYTVTVEPQDEEAYRNAGHENILVLPKNDMGVGYTVNYSKNQYDGVNPVVIMDDDIQNFFYSLEGLEKISLSLKTAEELKEFFAKLEYQILNTDFDFGTIGKSAFDWGYKDVSPRIAAPGTKINYSSAAVVTIINNKELLKFDLDETICLKNDIDFTLKCMYLGFRYAKFVHFLQQTTMNKDGKQPGGLAETYKKTEKIIKSQEILLKRWPNNMRVDEKKKPINGVPELKIIYKRFEPEPEVVQELRKKLNRY